MRLGFARVTLALAVVSAASLVVVACSSFSPEPDPVEPNDASTETGSTDGASNDGNASRDARPDAPGHDAHFSLSCGKLPPCETVGDVCCYEISRPPDTAYACARKGNACPVQTSPRLQCDDADDCTVLGFPGTVCCATMELVSPQFVLGAATCTQRANCAGKDNVERCDQAIADQCASGKRCLVLKEYPAPGDGGGVYSVRDPFPACER